MLQQDFQRTLPLLDMKYHDLHRYLADSVPNANAKDEVALDDARQELLLRILKAEPPQNTLVFANSIASANALFDFLEAQSIGEDGMQVLLFHKEVDRQQRQQVLDKLDDPNANVVVVCTDIAARGLDTTQVRHVVQYEFANDVVSHLHRIGRTARAGTAGKGLLHYFLYHAGAHLDRTCIPVELVLFVCSDQHRGQGERARAREDPRGGRIVTQRRVQPEA